VLTAAGQTRAGLARRLARAGYTGRAVEEACRRLTDLGYLDDRRFAASRARRRLDQGRGVRLVAAELRQKGVEADVIDEVLGMVDPDDQLVRARALAEKLLGARGRERTMAALVRRGYSPRIARRAVEEIAVD